MAVSTLKIYIYFDLTIELLTSTAFANIEQQLIATYQKSYF